MARPRHEAALWHTSYTSNGTAVASNYRLSATGSGGVTWVASSDAASLGWFNVKDYGAVGDGVTNDTTAINAAIAALVAAGKGVLYFPADSYLVSSALTTLSVPFLVLGDGTTTNNDTTEVGVTEVICSSATAVLFDVTANVGYFRGIGLRNSHASPSAGSGIYVHGSIAGQRISYDNIRVRRFYDNIDQSVGAYWSLHDAYILDAVRYNLRVRNTVSPDSGDWSITNSAFGSHERASSACVRIETSGGGKLTNVKMNSGTTKYVHGIDLAIGTGGTQTGVLNIANCSIENFSGDAIHGTTSAATSTYANITIVDLEVGAYSNNTGYAISLVGTTAGDFYDVVVIGGNFRTDGTARAAMQFTNVNNLLVSGIVLNTFNAYMTTTTCTNVRDYTGGIAGVTVTGTPSVGWVPTATSGTAATWQASGSVSYASNSNDVATVGAAGASTLVSRADHVHRGALSVSHTSNTFYGPITLATEGTVGITSPTAGTYIFNAGAGGGGGAGLGAWTTYAPTWAKTAGAAPSIGNGTLTGRYKALDSKTYAVHVHFQWGSTTNKGDNDGVYTLSLPAAAVSGFGQQIFAGHFLDSGTDSKVGNAQVADGGSTVFLNIEGINVWAPDVPVVMATGDQVQFSGIYEVA